MERHSWWLLSHEKLFHLLKSSPAGLSQEEALERLRFYGENILTEGDHHSILKIIVRQFSNFIVVILLISCAIAAFLGAWTDLVALALITLLNGIIGFIQECGAERSLRALRNLTRPIAHVKRSGMTQSLPAKELVPGDIVELQAGDVVPADGRILISYELTIDEAVLTGESIATTKIPDVLAAGIYPIADRDNMLFMGTKIVKGRGSMIVTETGRSTEFGKIASYLAEVAEPETQLNKQLARVGSVLIITAALIAALLMTIGVMKGIPLLALLYGSLSLFIAAVPEGLPTVITVALSRSVKRMASRHVLVRRLASVESLGSISVICTDKTGTLTQNRMVVTGIYAGRTKYIVTGTGIEPVGDILKGGIKVTVEQMPELQQLLTIAVLCNSAELQQKHGEWSFTGDPTEGALLTVAAKGGFVKSDYERRYPLVTEYPFDSLRKRMGMVREYGEGKRLFVKGALDGIVARSTRICLDGELRRMTNDDRRAIVEQHDQYARMALRVIAGAYRDCQNSPCGGSQEDEQNLVFVGLFAMSDPPRPEAKDALNETRKAGIRTIMITGDHKETAAAIGRAVGLIKEDGQVLTGIEIDTLSDEQLTEVLYVIPIYARVSVEHKIRIVKLLQEAGERVAMTGDGVNDSPALKMADIGIAMGITGTDVAKEASDIIITDDNYSSIVSAVQEGRGMYESLQKFVQYLLSSNLAEILVVLWGACYSFIAASDSAFVVLAPVQLLWINLISDGLPAIALVFDPLHTGLMEKKPSAFSSSLVAPPAFANLVAVGTILSLGVMASFFYGLSDSLLVAQTMAFTTLVFLEFMRLSSVRAEYKLSFFSNPLVMFALVLSLGLQILLLYVPFLQTIFQIVPLTALHWAIIAINVLVTWLIYKLYRSYSF